MANFVHTFNQGDNPVSLFQNTSGTFKVIYGKQITDNLSYEDAAAEYGSCVMHSLACIGLIDN